MTQFQEILIGNEQEKDEIDVGMRHEINAAMRDHELSTGTKKDKRMMTGYYDAHNTKRLRTEVRKISNYECEILFDDEDHPSIEATRRLTNEYGILVTAPKSVYKVVGIKEHLFEYLNAKYGISFDEWNKDLIHHGTQHVMVPFVETIKFYLFNLLNHKLYKKASSIYHTTEDEIYLDLMLLTDSKTCKNSREKRLTMVLAKFHSILSDKLELSDCVDSRDFVIICKLYTVHH